MPDQTPDPNGQPGNEPNPNQPHGEPPPNGEAPPEGGFTRLQMEQLATLTGRIMKKQIDENVMPLLARREEPGSVPPQNDTLKAFNEQLQQKIFEGDVLGAVQMANDVQNRAKENLTQNQTKEVDRVIVSYAEKPYYKDIHSDIEKIAKEAVKQGVPPQWAVEHAYHKALSEHLSGNRPDSGDGGSLHMIEGGRQQRRQVEAKLPDHFKEAAKRDIAKGLFKDEKDYISNLSPQIRKQYNI